MRCALLVLALIGCGSSARRPPPWRGAVITSMTWHLADLPHNGARLVVLPEPAAPTVTVIVRHPVGHKDDPARRPGLAHVAEHLRFQLRPGGGPTLWERLQDVAGSFNAVTSIDATTYVTTVLPADL